MFNPDALPPLRDVIARHNLRAEKKLGQNFLLDINITDKIVRAAGDLTGKTIYEIGPGPGGLTRSLLKTGATKVIAIEFDPRAIAALTELEQAAHGRLEIVHADALKFDFPCDRNQCVIANLPYNIATPLLIKWLRHISCYHSMTLMFQKEVAQRIVAPAGEKAYGRLSILSQWLCHVSKAFDLPPSAFTPPPKISSSIVTFIPRTLPADQPAFTCVEKLTAKAFGQRRKMLRSSIKEYSAAMKQAGIDETIRAEDLDVDGYIKLAKIIDHTAKATL